MYNIIYIYVEKPILRKDLHAAHAVDSVSNENGDWTHLSVTAFSVLIYNVIYTPKGTRRTPSLLV